MTTATAHAAPIAKRRRIQSLGMRRVSAPCVMCPLPTPPSPLVAEIDACVAETRTPNWDGYGAEPIADAVSIRARRLAGVLPPSLPMPEVAAAPSGSIDLEWRARRGDCISLCVYESGPVLYDGRIGGSEVAGEFQLAASIPARVADLLFSVAG